MEDIVRNKYRELTLSLINSNLTISTMESCTSGFIASLITDTENSSKVFKGSFVSYCNEAKIMCGVDSKVLDTYGVYSKETSIEMAKTCKEKFNTDIGIGITGSFSNIDPNNKDSVRGHVDYTIIYFNDVYSKDISLPINLNRHDSKLCVADDICDELNKIMKV